MQPRLSLAQETDLKIFRAPAGAVLQTDELHSTTVEVASIVRVAVHEFEFRENANTPGRLLEQAVVVDVPQGAGYPLLNSPDWSPRAWGEKREIIIRGKGIQSRRVSLRFQLCNAPSLRLSLRQIAVTRTPFPSSRTTRAL